jgi:hypothetical protein
MRRHGRVSVVTIRGTGLQRRVHALAVVLMLMLVLMVLVLLLMLQDSYVVVFRSRLLSLQHHHLL